MTNSLDDISQKLKKHYKQKFAEHGATPEGVDWGSNTADHLLRLDRMLAVLELGYWQDNRERPSLLDVGCGYGALFDYVQQRGLELDYFGIDICESMLEECKSRRSNDSNAAWLVGDILSLEGSRRFDYVVCNGIFTQKLEVSIKAMDQYMQTIVARMFDLWRIGIAFNVMTTHVNFIAPNLYYRNPAELLGWCMSTPTSRVRIDHAYPLFEYTVYLYREDAPDLQYRAHWKVKK